SDEVALPLSAPALDTRAGFLHWYVQTHWEAFTERPPVRLLQQLTVSGNLRRDMGEVAVCVLMHALRTPTTVVPATILTTLSGAMMAVTTVRDFALRRPHLLCVRAPQLGFLQGASGWQVLAHLIDHRPCLIPKEELLQSLPAAAPDALRWYSAHLDLPRSPDSIRELLPGGAFASSRAAYLATTRWAREHLEEHAAPTDHVDQARVLLLRWWDSHHNTAPPNDRDAVQRMLEAHGGVPPPRSSSSNATDSDTPSELADFIAGLGGAALMDRIYPLTADDSAVGQNQSLSQNLGIPRPFHGSPFLGGNSQTFGSQVQRGTQNSQISARDWRSQGVLLSQELGGEGDLAFPSFGQEGDTSTPTDGSNPEVTALRREITALQNQITTQAAPNQSGYGTGLPLNLSGTAPNANRSGVERPGYASASFSASSIIAMANLATPVQELGKQLHRLIDTCLALPLVNPSPGTLEASYAALFELKQHHLFTLNPGSLVILGMPLSGLASTISACPSGTVTYTEFLKGNLAVYRASNSIS
ncbi:hypothetical protein B484DRAFT_460579, partial [Ochromonadaceae sp. CCMP2298]